MGRSPNTDEDDMAKKVNASALGAFVLGAIALLVAAVVLFGSGKFFHKTFPYVMYFQGSVGGLSIGADVTFKGVRIGSVKSVRLETDLKDMSFSIPVIIELDPNLIGVQGGTTAEGQKLDNEARNELIKRLIKKGLRAELKQVSFVTGELQVTLDFFPDTPVRLVGNGSMMEIPTKQSTIEELTETVRQLPLQELVNKVIRTVDGIDKFMNSRDMQNIPQKVNGVMDEAGSLVKSIKQEVVPALEKLNDTLQSYQDLAQHVDRKVDPLMDGYTGVADQLKAKIGTLSQQLGNTLQTLEGALNQGKSTLQQLERTAGSNSATVMDLRKTLDNISNMAKSIRRLADYLERHPEALIQGKGPYRK